MFTFLITDVFLYMIVISLGCYIYYVRNNYDLSKNWKLVFKKTTGVISIVFLAFFIFIALIDSIHFKTKMWNEQKSEYVYTDNIESLLDKILKPIYINYEKSYSAPFSNHLYSKETILMENGEEIRIYPLLKYKVNLSHDNEDKIFNIVTIVLSSLLLVLLSFIFFFIIWYLVIFKEKSNISLIDSVILLIKNNIPLYFTLFILFFISTSLYNLSLEYYVLGTDKVGLDVLYKSIKSIRTGMIIGTLTTLVMLPFAIFLGILAGYMGGIIDDIIQYIYTTLNSIPSVLLIASAILMLQVYMSNNPIDFQNIYERADLRLFFLCLILGLTSWTGLCRLLRGESMKLRSIDYIKAAEIFGLKKISIIIRHFVPNIMHIVVITVVLDFSALVLAEAVLSYVNIGVDPTTYSWGNMINAARLELSREPVVWWSLFASFIFMFILVLFANLFADNVRDAFDPKSKGNK